MQAPNDASGVSFQTLSFGRAPSAAERTRIDDVARTSGGRVTWRSSERAQRTYALVESVEPAELGDALDAVQATRYQGAIIAVAVFPAAPEALPALLDAFGGAGRPAAVLACMPCPGGVTIEWAAARSSPALIGSLADVELRRYGAGRSMELLAPLPLELAASIAAQGLHAPEISAERVLEVLVERAGFGRA
jgi:hypothetical protein